MKNFILNNKYIIGLVLIVLLSLFQLTFFIYISKWDNIDAYLPSRFFVSDYLWNGKFPFWSPFQNLGTPTYSDMQSGSWYPITWVIMLFGKYTIGSLTIEILSCYIIAAFGFYKLSMFIYNNKGVSFLLALCYSLSGFMVGSSQILPFLIGIAWLPWIIYSLLSFLKTLKYKYAFLTSLFLSVCTSGASPPFIIILFYVFIGMFCYSLWRNRVERKHIGSIFLGGGIIGVITVLLLLPYINSFYEFLPYFNRAEKLPYEKLTYNSFTFYEYISFLFPFSISSDSELFSQTDLTLRSGYFGIIGFIYLIITFFTVRNKYIVPLAVFALLSLLFAAGATTPFYKLVYEIPGLAVFKHTSFFKVYFIFSCLLLAGFSLKKQLENNLPERIGDNIIKGLFGIVLLITIIAFIKTPEGNIEDVLGKLFSAEENFEGALSGHLFINGLVVIMLLFMLFFLKKKRNLFMGLAVVVICDMFIHTQMSAPKTIFNKISYNDASTFFDELPEQINQNSGNILIKDMEKKISLKKIDGFWRNLPTFNKTLSHTGYNPMKFKSYDEGEKNGMLEKNIVNPILFFNDKENTEIKSVLIGYNEFTAKIENSSEVSRKFLLNQNYHSQWKVYYNNEHLPISIENEMIIGVDIPPKSNGEIKFIFESPRTIYALTISLLTYFLVTIYLIKATFFRKKLV